MTPEEKQKLNMWTPERIKRFWEALGFKYDPLKCDCAVCAAMGWKDPNGFRCGLPDITDLNALEKWGLPAIDGYMIFTGEGGVHAIASKGGNNYEAVAETIALALAEAIEKALTGE